MQTVTKPLGFKRKVMNMYAGMFYLRPALKRELLSMIEHGQIVNDRQAVDFIDENGEWMSNVYV